MTIRLKNFWESAKQEFRRVNWPNWNETRSLTLVVIVFSVGTALFLGVLDFVFTYLLQVFFLS